MVNVASSLAPEHLARDAVLRLLGIPAPPVVPGQDSLPVRPDLRVERRGV
jgi:hypothetical protein